jgi:apolipoprotein D and lipocalin family protein
MRDPCFRPPTVPSAASFAAAIVMAAAAPPALAADELSTVGRVDLARYVGLWYEHARLPNRMQGECARDVTTTFSPKGGYSLDVVTRCRRPDGSVEVDGWVARVRDPATNAKLEIRFMPLAVAWLPFAWSDYWILDLAPDYGYALVGSPSRDALWIIARKPALDPGIYERLVTKARELGFDTGKLIRTPHS